MKKLIKGNEYGMFIFTNNCVNNIRKDINFKDNYLANKLSEQCEVYKHIINNIL